jgi:hypothetical protein
MNGAPIITGRVDGTDLTQRWGAEDGAPGGRIHFPVATARPRPGSMILIPELVPHDLQHVGSGSLSVLGGFSSDAPSASFE